MADKPIQLEIGLGEKIIEKFDIFVARATKMGMIGEVKNIRNLKPIKKYTYLTDLLFRNPIFIDKNMLILMKLVEKQCHQFGYTTKMLSEATAKALKLTPEDLKL